MNPPLLVWTHEENQLKGHLRGMPGTTLAVIEPANPHGDVFLMSAVTPDADEQTRRVLTVEAAKSLAEEQLLTWFRQAQPILAGDDQPIYWLTVEDECGTRTHLWRSAVTRDQALGQWLRGHLLKDTFDEAAGLLARLNAGERPDIVYGDYTDQSCDGNYAWVGQTVPTP